MNTPDFMLPPNHSNRSLHHTETYRNEEDLYEDLFGRGAGDPDMYGYPGEQEQTDTQ